MSVKTQTIIDEGSFWVLLQTIESVTIPPGGMKIKSFFQTPIPGKIWELTLLPQGNKKKNKNKNPYPNSPKRVCPRVM